MATLNFIKKFLDRRLHLTLHPQKTKLRPFRYSIDWLGYVLYPGYRVLRPCTRKRMWQNIRCAVGEYFNGRLPFGSLHSTIASYDGMIKYGWNGNDHKLLVKLWECI